MCGGKESDVRLKVSQILLFVKRACRRVTSKKQCKAEDAVCDIVCVMC